MLIAQAPALPLGEAGKYVAAAYLFLLAIVLIYVAIMALRLSRLQRGIKELNDLADAERAARTGEGDGGGGGPRGDEPPGAGRDGERSPRGGSELSARASSPERRP